MHAVVFKRKDLWSVKLYFVWSAWLSRMPLLTSPSYIAEGDVTLSSKGKPWRPLAVKLYFVRSAIFVALHATKEKIPKLWQKKKNSFFSKFCIAFGYIIYNRRQSIAPLGWLLQCFYFLPFVLPWSIYAQQSCAYCSETYSLGSLSFTDSNKVYYPKFCLSF